MIARATATIISGFTQDATTQPGALALMRKVLELDGIYVNYLTWADDVNAHASLLQQMFPGLPHYGWGYSFGGNTVANWSKAMLKINEPVAGLVLCDAVRHIKWYAPWTILGSIKVPSQVPVCVSYIQRHNKPDGDPVKHGKYTIEQTNLKATHNEIDEHVATHDAFIRMIGTQ